MNLNRDTHTILSNADGIVFANQKEWARLSSDDLSSLEGHMVITSKVSPGSVFFLLRNIDPHVWMSSRDRILMLKITTDEETGKVVFYTMDLNQDEAELIKDTPLPLWE